VSAVYPAGFVPGSSKGLDIKKKAKLAHSILGRIAEKKGYYLKLRKKHAVKV